MKTQGRPQSTNVVDATNFNQVEMFALSAGSELAGIGTDLKNTLTGPFGGPGYLVLPTNYKSSYTPNPVTDQRMAAWKQVNAPSQQMNDQIAQMTVIKRQMRPIDMAVTQPRNPPK